MFLALLCLAFQVLQPLLHLFCLLIGPILHLLQLLLPLPPLFLHPLNLPPPFINLLLQLPSLLLNLVQLDPLTRILILDKLQISHLRVILFNFLLHPFLLLFQLCELCGQLGDLFLEGEFLLAVGFGLGD